ncbi:MAG TPA: helix-turn-helix domain-containing protein [Terriglobia bacterium]|nr:helix-turn-helix domain-containing protein [Terriglobia bacterium]
MKARNQERLDMIRKLIKAGMSAADIGRKLGISRARASQLIHQAGYHSVTIIKKDYSI